MLDNVLDLLKGYAKDAIVNNQDIPSDKQNSAIETVVGAFSGELKDKLLSGGIGELTNLFSGGRTSGSSLISGLQNTVADALTQKVGLSTAISKMIAENVVPAIITSISGKVNDPDNGFSIDTLLSSLGDDQKNGLMEKLKGLFS